MIKIIIKLIFTIMLFIGSYITVVNAQIEQQRGSEISLKAFLDARTLGDYDKCERLLSIKYKNYFKNKYGYDFATYFRSKNEERYNKPLIKSIVTKNESTVNISLETEIEGPGYISRAEERFVLVKQNNNWKIDSWSIEYKETRSPN